MKIRITIIILFLKSFAFSQSKEFVILDETTNKPIDLAQIFYPNIEVGSISNANGEIRIPLRENTIVVSHINYIKRKFSFDSFKSKDTLFLTPKTNKLEEVVIYNIDLKQKFNNILDNTYLKKYSTKKVIHNSTYKETFSINDSLTRLFQVQLDWYSKNSLFKTDEAIEKQNVIKVNSIDYSKIKKIENDLVDSKGAHVENKSFFKFLHLNFILSTLSYLIDDYEIQTIESNEKSTNVYFNAAVSENGKEVFKHKNSLVVFDKNYESILGLKLNMVYSKGFEDAVSRINKMPYKKKTNSHNVELSFKKLKNDKYSIVYCIQELYGVIKTKNYTNNIHSKQSLFVNKSSLGKKIKKSNINFHEPFYENIPSNLKGDEVKILLTKKEKFFLKK